MKILFQGSLGAYSHLAALEVYPDSEIIPCKTFDECFGKANDDDKIRIIIPESNRITGNIGVEYFPLLPSREQPRRRCYVPVFRRWNAPAAASRGRKKTRWNAARAPRATM